MQEEEFGSASDATRPHGRAPISMANFVRKNVNLDAVMGVGEAFCRALINCHLIYDG
jgi:hypothetical protein